jgi:fatty-acyl-CoA synthase
LGKISTGRTAAGRFEGYTSEQATAKKILSDVFVSGDRWFRTGDLVRRDADGFYHFVDRAGDTFRWKGENVSTQEVAEAVTGFPDVSLCAVYGVEVPGTDGRAGMASVVLREGAKLSGAALHAHLAHSLPSYARPVFLRVQDAPDMTGTFKLQKARLKREGFDPERVSDPLYFRDDERGAYRPLTDELYARLQAGELRF